MPRLLHLAFALFTFGPILLWIGAIALVIVLGEWGGCQINEAGAHPCTFRGREVGELAATAGLFAAWGPLIFGPVVVGAGILWALVAGVLAILRRKR